jgi:hypothetical protein
MKGNGKSTLEGPFSKPVKASAVITKLMTYVDVTFMKSSLKVTGSGKDFLVHIMEAYKGGRGVALFILTSVQMEGNSLLHALVILLPENNAVLIE